MSWSKVKLSEVCEIVGGSTPRTSREEYWGGVIPWLSPVDLPEVGTISRVESTQRSITQMAVADSGLRILPPGAVVFSTRASIGKIGIVVGPLTTNQGFTSFIPSNRVDSNYLAYALKASIPQIKKLGNATTFLEVSRSSIKEFKIPLPPLPVQQRIADILDTADALRRKDRELLQQYDALARSIFVDMFGDPQAIQGDVSLADYLVINPRRTEVEVEEGTEVSFVPMAAVGEDGSIDVSQSKHFQEVKTGYTYFAEGDVLFAKITPCMENGKGAIARGLRNGIGFGSTEFHVLRPLDPLSSEFVYHLLAMKSIRRRAEANMKGAVGQKRVPTDFFNKVRINFPDHDLIQTFSLAIRSLEEQQLLIKKSLANSEDLFDSLLQRSFKGELTA